MERINQSLHSSLYRIQNYWQLWNVWQANHKYGFLELSLFNYIVGVVFSYRDYSGKRLNNNF